MFLGSRSAISPSQNVWNFLLFSPAIPRLFTVSWDRLDIPRLTVTAILIFKCTKGAGVGEYSSGGRAWGRKKYFSRFLPNRPCPLSSFDTHATWQPVTQSARSRWTYGKIEDCEQIWQTLAGYEELAGGFEPVKNAEMFWINNNSHYYWWLP